MKLKIVIKFVKYDTNTTMQKPKAEDENMYAWNCNSISDNLIILLLFGSIYMLN